MTQPERQAALGLGPEWIVIWEGHHALPELAHLCGGLSGPGGTYESGYLRLRYEATGIPGIEAAVCARCRKAWVRGVGEETAPR